LWVGDDVGFRFRRSFKLLLGVRLNLGSKSTSLSRLAAWQVYEHGLEFLTYGNLVQHIGPRALQQLKTQK